MGNARGVYAMSGSDRAEACWEVERRSCGEVYRSYYMVLLKNKKAAKSVVKATSSDAQSMNKLVEKLQEDLHELTDDDFVSKYNLGSAS